MTIAIDWDIKQQIKRAIQEGFSSFGMHWSSYRAEAKKKYKKENIVQMTEHDKSRIYCSEIANAFIKYALE